MRQIQFGNRAWAESFSAGSINLSDAWQLSVLEGLLERVRFQPWLARQLQQREGVGHALKLSPQEQEVAALGLLTLNPIPPDRFDNPARYR